MALGQPVPLESQGEVGLVMLVTFHVRLTFCLAIGSAFLGWLRWLCSSRVLNECQSRAACGRIWVVAMGML